MLREKVMTIFPRSPVWDVIRELAKTLNVLDCIFENIDKKVLKFRPELHHDFSSNGF